MDAPPVLTPERIDLMLSIMAEVCLESVVEAGRFQKEAADAEAFERSGRALQRACRNLRQTIALKQRFDREQGHAAEVARKVAQGERDEAERIHRHRVERRKASLNRHFEQVLWNELERPDAEELFDELMMRVKDAGNEDAFLETPMEDLVVRFADEIGILAAAETERDAPPSPLPSPLPGRSAETLRGRVSGRSVGGGGETPSLESTPPPQPLPAGGRGSEAPPHPPPEEPYVPPWERLRPGAIMPGGSGW